MAFDSVQAGPHRVAFETKTGASTEFARKVSTNDRKRALYRSGSVLSAKSDSPWCQSTWVTRYRVVRSCTSGSMVALSEPPLAHCSTSDAPTTGRKEIQRRFGRTWKAFPDMKEEPATPLAVEDFTVSEVVVRGTQKGALGPLKPSKKAMAIHQADIVQWKDGKMVRAWVYGNAKEMFDQLSAGKK